MKIVKAEINKIIKNYEIHEIEGALIKLYLEYRGIKKIENKLLIECSEKSEDPLLVKKFSRLIPKKDLKSIERVFELLIEPEDRKLNGAFYTPEFIVKYIVNNTVQGDIKICDPSCGSGAFLIEAVEKVHKDTGKNIVAIIENNIYGCDILDYAVRRAKLLLSLLAVTYGEDKEHIKFNLICGDSLTLDWTEAFPEILSSGDWKDTFGLSENGFDVVIGNPPYVRIQDFGRATKEVLMERWHTVKRGNFNLHFSFFELGIKILKMGGKLGYITPNNYFTSLSAEHLRKYLQENRLLSRILDFNHLQLFEDVQTYTCITLIEKRKKETFGYQIIEEYEKLSDLDKASFDEISFDDLNYKKWRLLNKQDYENVKKIESSGSPLKEVTDIHVGIATLKDVLYFIDGTKENGDYYIKEYGGEKFFIEKEITRPIRKISTLENDEDVKKDQRRIIFPYKLKKEKAVIIPESEFKDNYPKCYDYFLHIRNELAKRDKGKNQYPEWFAYGRSQGLTWLDKKLLTRTFSNKPNFMFDSNEESLFCNGYAIFQKPNELDLKVLQKILNSVVMDYFARKTSVDIEGGYQCYQKNFIQSFNIPQLSEDDIRFLKHEKNGQKIDDFLIKKYGLNRDPLEHLI